MGKIFACWIAWLGLTGAALAFVAYQAMCWASVAARLDAEMVSPARVIPPGGIFLENDSPTWLGYAERIARGEDWRVRFTPADNTPFGREVHWSQGISWLLVLLGKIRQAASGGDLRTALADAAVWLNPLLHGLLILSLGLAFLRRAGVIPAGLLALYLAAAGNLGFAFHALRPDHQSLQIIFGAWTAAGLLLGGAGQLGVADGRIAWFKPLEAPDFSSARSWFLVSGVAAGLGLWVSAAVQGVLLLLIFAAGLVLTARQPSTLWRWWGRAAGLTSLLCYLLEYFPHHLALHLEVNGPWYSLTVLAMGEALGRRRHRWLLTASAALLPLAIVFGPPAWHALRDPHMFRLHQHIEEFLSLPRAAGPGWPAKYLRDFGLLPLFFLVALWRWRASAAIVLAFALALGTLALGLMQIRWLGLAELMNILLAIVAGLAVWPVLPRRPWLPAALVIVLLLQPFIFIAGFVCDIRPILAGAVVPREFIYPLMAKRIALAFRDLAGPGARVLASPSIAPALRYFADASVVSSLYWENRDGVNAGLAFLTDEGDATALRLARERGLSYILLLPEKQMPEELRAIAGLDPSRKILYERLAGGLNPPPWAVADAATKKADSEPWFYRGNPLEARCRIYRIIVPADK